MIHNGSPGDLLASITDTLSAKPYQPLSVPTPIGSELGPEYVKQADFALETQLRIGDEEASIVQFGGREFRWTNASLESDTRVSVGLKAKRGRFSRRRGTESVPKRTRMGAWSARFQEERTHDWRQARAPADPVTSFDLFF